MKIVTNPEMREIDRITSAQFGVPSLTLMENAGSAVADFVAREYVGARSIYVVCGKGNNGGDGFVAARKLHEIPVIRKGVVVLLLGERTEVKGDAATMLEKLPVEVRCIRDAGELSAILPKNPDRPATLRHEHVIIDALLGSGVKLPVTGLYAEAIAAIDASAGPVVSIDVPSGANADDNSQAGPVVRADAVVTFTAPRLAHVFGGLTVGPTVVANIGSPSEAVVTASQLNVISPDLFAGMLAPRRADSNKGLYGHVFLIGGSRGKAGSIAMSGMAALRAGGGLSTVATARSLLNTVCGFYPELMTEPLRETEQGTISAEAFADVQELSKGKTVLAIGPGISRNGETSEFVRRLVSEKNGTPIVLDADGLNAFEGRANELAGGSRTLVITPHPGEMARLLGWSVPDVQKDRVGVARSFARDHNLIVVLKGDRTVVATPDGEAWINVTGNPGMATGGTGDILTGMVAGLIAQNRSDPFTAVLAAVYLHGLSGDIMRDRLGEHSLVATDLLRGLPDAFLRTASAAKHSFFSWK